MKGLETTDACVLTGHIFSPYSNNRMSHCTLQTSCINNYTPSYNCMGFSNCTLPDTIERPSMDVIDDVEQFVRSLPTLVREVERNTHNLNVSVLEALSRRLEDSLDLLQVIQSRLSDFSTSPDVIGYLSRLRLILQQCQETCNVPTFRSSVETCSTAVTTRTQDIPGRPSLWLPRETPDFC